MAKKAAKPKQAETEADETAPTISKAEAVRQALAAGMETPADGTGFLKSTYGIDDDEPDVVFLQGATEGTRRQELGRA
jgi:hypothetical protein